MIIQPKNESPIREAVGSLMDLIVFPVYQTRSDYTEAFGHEPPPADPNRRPKAWFDPAYAGIAPEDDDGELVSYLALAVHHRTGQLLPGPDGRPRLAQMWLSKWEAGSVNIPTGLANEFPPDARIYWAAVQPPVRPLHEDERLENSPFGVRVANVRLRAEELAEADQFTAADRRLLQAIAEKLGVAS